MAGGVESGAERPEAIVARVIELVRAVWAARDPERLPGPVLEALRTSLGADWAALVAPEAAGDRLVPVATAGTRAPEAGPRVSRTALEKLRASREPLLLMALDDEAGEASPESIPLEVQSVIAARLGAGEADLGTLYLESRARRRTFGPAETVLLERLGALLGEQLAHARSAREAAEERDRLAALARLGAPPPGPDLGLVGRSAALGALRADLGKIGPTASTVLILGETGTGKELVARALHALSPRAGRPFVALNAAALPEGLVESELFGHEAGAFSGATGRKPGRFELAHRGTLFLDEVADLAPAAQAKLLRVLEERVVTPLGGGQGKPVDVRVLAATRADLEARVREGRFREDLFYRLAVLRVTVPPLRDRLEDLPVLADHFLRAFPAARGAGARRLDPEALAVLAGHRWPGNVRELRNRIEAACVRAEGDRIGPADFGLGVPAGPGGGTRPTLAEAHARWERDYLARVLEAEAGDVAAVLARLGISKTAFYMRCKEYGLEPAGFRGRGPGGG